jgi:TPR repeat protein
MKHRSILASCAALIFCGLQVAPIAAEPPEAMIESLREQAAQGDPQACYELGRKYLVGKSTPRNLPEARRLLQSAAEAGHHGAMGSFGYMLARGIGMDADPAAGFVWIQKAADAGVSSAMLNQGIMTLRGQGVARDVEAGLTLIRKAADQGLVEAQARLAEAYFLGEDGLVTKSDEAAAPWAMKAADAGHAWSQNLVGTLLEFGRGLPMDRPAAMQWYRRAAQQGQLKAQSTLGRHLFNGSIEPADRVAAYYWLRASGDQGEVTARNFFSEIESAFTPEEKAAGEARLRESPPPQSGEKTLGPGPPVPRAKPATAPNP